MEIRSEDAHLSLKTEINSDFDIIDGEGKILNYHVDFI